MRKPSGPKNSSPSPASRKCSASETINSTSTEASATGCSASRATSGASGTTSAIAATTCSAAGAPQPFNAQASAQGSAGSTPQPNTARGICATSPRRRHAVTSTATATAASVSTSQIVGGRRPVSNAARLSAANAAMSPNGTKTTRVTEKISTRPIPASR